MKIKKKQIVGIMLGVGFMVLGILQIAYPELADANTQSGTSFALFIGSILFILGLAQVLYIMVYK
jgi:protein-S-isoprenylcysteine O-methyltransferase Ste14